MVTPLFLFSGTQNNFLQILIVNPPISKETKNTWKNLKLQPFNIITNCISIRKWLGDKKRYNTIYRMMSLDCPCIDFFDDFFGYSINSLNKVIYNMYKSN
jgi:hypothetical protein